MDCVGATSQSILSSQRVSLSVSSEAPFTQLLIRFWEIEELIIHTMLFTEDHKCEENFRRTNSCKNFDYELKTAFYQNLFHTFFILESYKRVVFCELVTNE